jgi:hypothetical protein
MHRDAGDVPGLARGKDRVDAALAGALDEVRMSAMPMPRRWKSGAT